VTKPADLFSPAALFRITSLGLLGVLTYFAKADHETLDWVVRMSIRHDTEIEHHAEDISDLKRQVGQMHGRGRFGPTSSITNRYGEAIAR
jgi:hypothetical protein